MKGWQAQVNKFVRSVLVVGWSLFSFFSNLSPLFLPASLYTWTVFTSPSKILSSMARVVLFLPALNPRHDQFHRLSSTARTGEEEHRKRKKNGREHGEEQTNSRRELSFFCLYPAPLGFGPSPNDPGYACGRTKPHPSPPMPPPLATLASPRPPPRCLSPSGVSQYYCNMLEACLTSRMATTKPQSPDHRICHNAAGMS